MNHIDLNAAPEVVRQFILSIPASGTVFELDGRAVACLVPPPTQDEDGEWTAANNDRRSYLIDRQIDGSITGEETAELEALQSRMGRWLDEVAPLPLDHVRQLHRELLDLADREAAAGNP